MTEPLIAPKKTISAEKHNKIVETIRRALRLSESSNPHEAAAAAAKAAELMHKYSIEQFEIEQAQSSHENLIREGFYNADRPEISWQFDLLGNIARVNFCKCYLFQHSEPPRYHLVGQPHHIEISVYIFDYLCSEIEIYEDADLAVWRLTRKREGLRPASSNDVATWRRSFRQGCSIIIIKRLTAEFDRLNREAATSTALVIYNDKQIAEFLNQNGYRIGGSYQPPTRALDMSGYASGQRRGASIDLARHGIRDADNEPTPRLQQSKLRITEHKRI